MQHRPSSSSQGFPFQVDQQVQRVVAASLVLAEQTFLLGLALQAAWVEAWMRPLLQASEACRHWHTQQERRARLVRRGIPDRLARRGLRLVEP
ncbi:hypothetical protein [Methylobacterium sp. ID0610]|uniref:hypothetical protein n=1 Tax=Methylobacterium carpenticola TaxID=3344827 RepID=UPI00369671B3